MRLWRLDSNKHLTCYLLKSNHFQTAVPQQRFYCNYLASDHDRTSNIASKLHMKKQKVEHMRSAA